MLRIADATIVGEWATGHFAQDAEDLLTTSLEAIQRMKTSLDSDNPQMLEIEEIVTRHTPDIEPESQAIDCDRLSDLLNSLAPDGYYWGVKDSGDQKSIGYWEV